jgi:hypothetical protein
MKNIFLFLMVLCFLAFTNKTNAQDVQLATLQSGEDLQVFYGVDALKNALDAAGNGDLITLSAGTFNAATITKAVLM